jgi:hypothetical protein
LARGTFFMILLGLMPFHSLDAMRRLALTAGNAPMIR